VDVTKHIWHQGVICRLEADPATLTKKLRLRHGSKPAELDWHLGRAGELAAILRAASVDHLTVDNSAGSPIANNDPSEYDWREMVNHLADGVAGVAGTVAVAGTIALLICGEVVPIAGPLSWGPQQSRSPPATRPAPASPATPPAPKPSSVPPSSSALANSGWAGQPKAWLLAPLPFTVS